MDREARIINAIRPFVPAGTEQRLANDLLQYRCQLTITRDRKTKAGDYRHPWGNHGHRISVNGTLNQYAFLITLVHELAHLVTWENHRNKVSPHGKEWKQTFQREMEPYLAANIFPADVHKELLRHMKKPLSATVRDVDLMRALRHYDDEPVGMLLEDVPTGAEFSLGNKLFIKGEKLRKRYRCEQPKTGRIYLISSIAEVELA
jgi:Zn-dependent peptidase ImmA (M78 family)